MHADVNNDALGNEEWTADVLNEVGIVDDNEGGITNGNEEWTADDNEEGTVDDNEEGNTNDNEEVQLMVMKIACWC